MIDDMIDEMIVMMAGRVSRKMGLPIAIYNQCVFDVFVPTLHTII